MPNHHNHPPAAHDDAGPVGLRSLLRLLRQGQTAVPAVKYAVGVVGVAAAAGIVNLVLGNTRASLISLASMFIAMVILFVFSRLVAAGSSSSVTTAANVLLWVVVLLFSAALILCVTAIAFDWPYGLRGMLMPSQELSNAELIERVRTRESIEDTRDALQELGKRCAKDCPDKQRVVDAIKDLLKRTDKTERTLKVPAIAALRKIIGRNLYEVLSDEFERAHIVETDFSLTNLTGVSFDSSFAILNNFSFADLSGVNFSNAYLRGSNFKGAKLSGLKMAGADWFNTFNLERDQLAGLRGLSKCPPFYRDGTLNPFIVANDAKYANKFVEYGPDHQKELKANWSRYASDGGACDFVETLVQ